MIQKEKKQYELNFNVNTTIVKETSFSYYAYADEKIYFLIVAPGIYRQALSVQNVGDSSNGLKPFWSFCTFCLWSG